MSRWLPPRLGWVLGKETLNIQPVLHPDSSLSLP